MSKKTYNPAVEQLPEKHYETTIPLILPKRPPHESGTERGTRNTKSERAAPILAPRIDFFEPLMPDLVKCRICLALVENSDKDSHLQRGHQGMLFYNSKNRKSYIDVYDAILDIFDDFGAKTTSADVKKVKARALKVLRLPSCNFRTGYSCAECGDRFWCVDEIRAHYKSCPNPTGTTNNKRICKLFCRHCNLAFSSADERRNHFRSKKCFVTKEVLHALVKIKNDKPAMEIGEPLEERHDARSKKNKRHCDSSDDDETFKYQQRRSRHSDDQHHAEVRREGRSRSKRRHSSESDVSDGEHYRAKIRLEEGNKLKQRRSRHTDITIYNQLQEKARAEEASAQRHKEGPLQNGDRSEKRFDRHRH